MISFISSKRPRDILATMHWLSPKPIYLAVLFIYAFAYLPFPEAHRTIGTLLLMVFFWAVFLSQSTSHVRRMVVTDPIFKLMLVLFVFLLVAQIWYYFSRPDYIDTSFRAARHYLKPIMILVIGIGLYLCGRTSRWWLLLTALVGFLFYLVFQTDPHDWLAAQQGERVDFGIHNAQHAAMLFGTMLLALLIFAPRAISSTAGKARLVITISLLAGISLAVFGVLVTQVRGIWLGLLAALCLGAFLYPFLFTRTAGARKKQLYQYLIGYPLLVGLILIVGIVGFNADDIIEQRLQGEDISLNTVTEDFSVEAATISSTAVRLASWAAAWQWISERPWMGWGPEATRSLILHSDHFSDSFKRNFGHLHNSFLEVLVSNGIPGAVILASLAIWFGIAIIRAYAGGAMPPDVFVFAWLFFAFWLVINTFESYILYSSGQYLNAVIGGFLYSFYLMLNKENTGQ